MEKRIVLLALLIFAIPFLACADEGGGPTVRRLDYVRFDTTTQSVEWGVTEGTVNGAGEFIPYKDATTKYSMQLETGKITHDGQDELLSSSDANDASRAFQALSRLMAIYTDKWDGRDESPDADSPADETGSDPSLARIAQKHAARTSRRKNQITRIRAVAPAFTGTIPAPLSLH